MTERNAWIDQAKGIACLLIVLHHLAFYGPMSKVVEAQVPSLMHWLSQYGRMAVQIFLVLGGYFAAAALAPQGKARNSELMPLVAKRYTRLVIPFAAALLVTMVVTETVRNLGFEHASMSAPASWQQVLAHLLMLQGIGGWESLSAGVWYVAIDFQLFVTLAFIFAAQRWSLREGQLMASLRLNVDDISVGQCVVVILGAASLWYWNLDSGLDNWAVYFFGAYALGVMAWWAAHAPSHAQRWGWVLCMVLLGAIALIITWRTRIALAWSASLLLATANMVRWPQALQSWRWTPLKMLGQQSYSVFLIHFSMCLLVNALWTMWWPDSLPMNALGLLVAVVLSLCAAQLIYRYVETQGAGWRQLLHWHMGALGVGLAVGWNVI